MFFILLNRSFINFFKPRAFDRFPFGINFTTVKQNVYNATSRTCGRRSKGVFSLKIQIYSKLSSWGLDGTEIKCKFGFQILQFDWFKLHGMHIQYYSICKIVEIDDSDSLWIKITLLNIQSAKQLKSAFWFAVDENNHFEYWIWNVFFQSRSFFRFNRVSLNLRTGT